MTETRDPGDIENDEIAPDEDDTPDTSADSAGQPLADEADASVSDAEEGETDAPIGHPEGYVAPEDSPAPIYNPDDEEEITGGA